MKAFYNGGPAPGTPYGWNWNFAGPIASGIGEGAGVRFADINNDGRADFIWLGKGGDATILLNVKGQSTPIWDPLNDNKPVASGVGGFREDIRFADIDGDGKAVGATSISPSSIQTVSCSCFSRTTFGFIPKTDLSTFTGTYLGRIKPISFLWANMREESGFLVHASISQDLIIQVVLVIFLSSQVRADLLRG